MTHDERMTKSETRRMLARSEPAVPAHCGKGAKRVDCVEIASALGDAGWSECAGKPDALQTLARRSYAFCLQRFSGLSPSTLFRPSDFGLRALFVIRHASFALFFGALLPCLAQTNAASLATNLPPPAVATTNVSAWSFSASVYGYLVPDSRDYVQPTFTADQDWLHLEARYNYEALDTGSAWLGYNLGGGRKVEWSLTPMLGGVFGDLNGIAPGYEFSVNWWKLELYSEGEYYVDLGDSSGSFFYNWSELSLYPVAWFRVGMVTQRTRLYDSDRDIQRGFLLGVSFKCFDFTTYVFNPGTGEPTVVLALGASF
jgi:hypothetical protein